MTGRPSGFVWHELVTPDPKAALRFYEDVIGWTTQQVPGGGGEPYTMLLANGRGMGGVFKATGGMTTGWIGYLYSDDVDAGVKRLVAAGAKVMRPPEDVPMAGRLAPMTDPQGAGFILFKPQPPPGSDEMVPASGQGSVGWNEYFAKDLPGAVEFYVTQFGFKKIRAVEMGPMGTYQVLDSSGDKGSMGMMKGPEAVWQFYFRIDDIDAAAERIKKAGGTVTSGPQKVPTGNRVLLAKDPQGGVFGLITY